MTTGERYAPKGARTVREGADGKGPEPRAPRRRPTSLCERPGVRFPRPTLLVAGFEYEDDARQFLVDLRERFAKFGLELHPDNRVTRKVVFPVQG